MDKAIILKRKGQILDILGVINQEEYLSGITQIIPTEKIPVIIEKEKFPFEKWFITAPGDETLWWIHKPFEGKHYTIFIDIYRSNPPASSDKIRFNKYDPITGWESPNEIPREVAEKSLRALFPEKKIILPEMVFSSYGAIISISLL